MPSKNEDLCSEPHCRTTATIIVLGAPLCAKHNEQRLERIEREMTQALVRREKKISAGDPRA